MADIAPAEDRPLRKLRHVVERLTYQNPENGFTAAHLAAERPEAEAARGEDRLVTVVGTLADLAPAEATFAVIDDDPNRLTEAPDIDPIRASRIAAASAEQRHIREVMATLQGLRFLHLVGGADLREAR